MDRSFLFLHSRAIRFRSWWYTMTAEVYTSRVLPRIRSSHAQQLVFSARQTCSSVTSGFFPPQPLRLAGNKNHGQQAQNQVPQQADIMAAFIMSKAQLALANPNRMLDIPPPEGHAEQFLQGRIGRSIRDKILH